MQTGRPEVVSEYSTRQGGEDKNTQNICPAALGTKDQQPAAFSPQSGMFYVPTNHVCMDYEPFKVSYTAGQPYRRCDAVDVSAAGRAATSATSSPGMRRTGKIVWSNPEPFSVWSGALATAGDIVFYGTLEGYLKAVDAATGKELYRFTHAVRHHRQRDDLRAQRQAVGRGSVRRRRLGRHRHGRGAYEGHGRTGCGGRVQARCRNYTQLGGVLTVFSLPD